MKPIDTFKALRRYTFESVYKKIQEARKTPYGMRGMEKEEMQMHLEGTGWTYSKYIKEWDRRIEEGIL